jgi:hypothetical protein
VRKPLPRTGLSPKHPEFVTSQRRIPLPVNPREERNEQRRGAQERAEPRADSRSSTASIDLVRIEQLVTRLRVPHGQKSASVPYEERSIV